MNDEHIAHLKAIARSSPWFMKALRAASELGLPAWCVGAGAVRNLVWDHLQGHAVPSALADIDLAYFDDGEAEGLERTHQARLEQACPSLPWEVTNQAHVHAWFEGVFGHPVAPLRDLTEAVASWPEFATSVGITVDEQGELQIIAPHGLDDLFAMRVRRNPTRVSVTTYNARVTQKQYVLRWPSVTVEEEPTAPTPPWFGG